MSIIASSGADEHGATGLASAATVAAVAAACLNASLYLIGVATGTFASFGWFPVGPGGEMMLGPILLVSVLAVLAGVGTYATLRGLTERPRRTFERMADTVLLLSLVPLLLSGWPLPQALLLGLMHAVTAGVVLQAVRG